MEIFYSVLLIVVGLALLVLGGEGLVRGAGSLSKKAGIPPIVIGLTVVAFGTSAPELVVNIFSAIEGTTDLALGNILGSNISNILLILGICAVIANLKVQKTTTWKEIPFAGLSIFVLFALANDVLIDFGITNTISRIDGIVLLSFFLIFLYYTVGIVVNNKNKSEEVEELATYGYMTSSILLLSGLVLLFFGGKILVDNAVYLAKLAGLSEMFIGLTIVGIGTSLPELVTSVIATRKGETDMAIGNIIGSNIFNILWILGITSVIFPIPITHGANFDIAFALIVTVILFIFIFMGKRHMIQKWQGYALLILYVIYMLYLVYRG